jgi:hypothetical protein
MIVDNMLINRVIQRSDPHLKAGVLAAEVMLVFRKGGKLPAAFGVIGRSGGRG